MIHMGVYVERVELADSGFGTQVVITLERRSYSLHPVMKADIPEDFKQALHDWLKT